MDAAPFTLQTIVEDVLKAAPHTDRVFLHFHTGCIGCRLTRFCTLEEVAGYYGLDNGLLLASLQQAADEIIESQRSSQ